MIKLLNRTKYRRLELYMTRRRAEHEISRRVYLSSEANSMNLAGIVWFDAASDMICLILEGEQINLERFLGFVRKSYGTFERLMYRYRKDKNEFDFVQVV